MEKTVAASESFLKADSKTGQQISQYEHNTLNKCLTTLFNFLLPTHVGAYYSKPGQHVAPNVDQHVGQV